MFNNYFLVEGKSKCAHCITAKKLVIVKVNLILECVFKLLHTVAVKTKMFSYVFVMLTEFSFCVDVVDWLLVLKVPLKICDLK